MGASRNNITHRLVPMEKSHFLFPGYRLLEVNDYGGRTHPL